MFALCFIPGCRLVWIEEAFQITRQACERRAPRQGEPSLLTATGTLKEGRAAATTLKAGADEQQTKSPAQPHHAGMHVNMFYNDFYSCVRLVLPAVVVYSIIGLVMMSV